MTIARPDPGNLIATVDQLVDAANAGGGGGVAGSPVIRKFSFAFNTPNILTGAVLYTPAIGDVILDFWIEIDIPWDGITPLGDVGMFDGSSPQYGWFANGTSGPIDISIADQNVIGAGVLNQGGSATQPSSFSQALQRAWAGVPNFSYLPFKIAMAHPIKIVVSQDGTDIGASPDSTQGSASLYLITATPI